MRLYYIYTDSNKAPTLPVEALLLPLRMPLFCSFEIIALVGCGIAANPFLFLRFKARLRVCLQCSACLRLYLQCDTHSCFLRLYPFRRFLLFRCIPAFRLFGFFEYMLCFSRRIRRIFARARNHLRHQSNPLFIFPAERHLNKIAARMLSSSVIYESSNRELLKRTLQYVYCCFARLSVFVAMVCDSSKHLSVVVTLLKPYHSISSGYSIFGSIMECHFIISS